MRLRGTGWADEEDLWMWGTRGGGSGNCVGVAEGTTSIFRWISIAEGKAIDAWDGRDPICAFVFVPLFELTSFFERIGTSFTPELYVKR